MAESRAGKVRVNFEGGLDFAKAQDAADPLASFRDRFVIPQRPEGGDVIYFCGNSLGLQPKSAVAMVGEELDVWGALAVGAHFDAERAWVSYQERLAPATAAIVGAEPSEVVTMNTLTVNLHLMMVSFYRPTPARHKIVIECPAFPSDRYAVESQIRFHGFDPATSLIEVGPREGESTIRMEDLAARIEANGPAIALLMLPGVNYYSGQVFDMAALTRLGHAQGCQVGFDLAHAAGNILLRLHDWDADFAVWCTYKYLNGGPGSIAGCFVHDRHRDWADQPRLAGWWGHDKASRFKMGPDFTPIPGAEGWQMSNAPILSTAPVLASLGIFEEAGMPALGAKSERLTSYLAYLVEERLGDHLEILTPADSAERGCQLSLRVQGARGDQRRVFEALEANGVVCDWREPDVIRVAPVPLYNRFEEVFEFVGILQGALATPV
ncbi:MAG: kynureninase [Dehalococcoidia bacterium]|jgi:kynureninase|nr:kynureninase [Dehalococcoidia bacterium]